MQKGEIIIFLLPGLEKKFVSDFAVNNKVMNKGGIFFFIARQTKR